MALFCDLQQDPRLLGASSAVKKLTHLQSQAVYNQEQTGQAFTGRTHGAAHLLGAHCQEGLQALLGLLTLQACPAAAGSWRAQAQETAHTSAGQDTVLLLPRAQELSSRAELLHSMQQLQAPDRGYA